MKTITHYVDVGSNETEGFVLKARCLFDGESVQIVGTDQTLVETLRRGVAGVNFEGVRPKDGLAFLYAVSEGFRTPQLLASSVYTGAPADSLED